MTEFNGLMSLTAADASESRTCTHWFRCLSSAPRHSDSEPDRISEWKKRDEERRRELEERRKKEEAEEQGLVREDWA